MHILLSTNESWIYPGLIFVRTSMVEGAIYVSRIRGRRMETPLPSPEFSVRPAPPLNLSMVLVERGGRGPPSAPFALLGGVTPPLRKVVQTPLFEVFDEKVYLIRSPTQIMRLIDSLRYHKPTVEEREELNLVSSTERLYLHNLTDLLLACGGRKGFRFTSTDINRLRRVCACVSQQYEILNESFEKLPLEVTRFRFPPEVKRIEDVTDLRLAHAGGDEDAVQWQAYQFQRLARDYVDSYARLRDTVSDIRMRFDEYLTQKSACDQIEVLPEPVEAEFEAKANHPFPQFLHCLIQKYHREQRKMSTQWTPSCSEPPVDSIGVFCVYLAYVLLQQETLTQDEVHSFEVLLQVLKLSYRVDHKQLRIVDISRLDAAESPLSSGIGVVPGQIVTNTTLCAILYEFLSTVRELRLVNKEKKLLPRRRSRRRIPRWFARSPAQ